jgi:hypothetical protein
VRRRCLDDMVVIEHEVRAIGIGVSNALRAAVDASTDARGRTSISKVIESVSLGRSDSEHVVQTSAMTRRAAASPM